MGWHKIKRRPADAVLSEIVRRKESRCAFQVTPNCKLRGGERHWRDLHACHFIGRRNESTRFDFDNVDAGCPMCHKYMDEHKNFFRGWKQNQLGIRKYNKLIARSLMLTKKDDKLTMLRLKPMLDELRNT